MKKHDNLSELNKQLYNCQQRLNILQQKLHSHKNVNSISVYQQINSLEQKCNQLPDKIPSFTIFHRLYLENQSSLDLPSQPQENVLKEAVLMNQDLLAKYLDDQLYITGSSNTLNTTTFQKVLDLKSSMEVLDANESQVSCQTLHLHQRVMKLIIEYNQIIDLISKKLSLYDAKIRDSE